MIASSAWARQPRSGAVRLCHRNKPQLLTAIPTRVANYAAFDKHFRICISNFVSKFVIRRLSRVCHGARNDPAFTMVIATAQPQAISI